MNRLILSNVSKKFGSCTALNNVNIEIKPGVFGLLGPNGAGKTTLMKCIVNLIDNYTGKIILNDKSLNSKSINKIQLGYLPQKFSLYKYLTVYEALEHIALLKKVKNYKDNINKILEDVNLSLEKKKKVKNLSGGMLRRLGIAQALIGDPKILVIDEPTAGLDPKERVRFRNILTRIPKDIIVIISTHIVEDLNLIADYIAVIDKGNLIVHNSLSVMLKQMEGKVYTKFIKIDELQNYENKYIVTNIIQSNEGIMLRIVGDDIPENSIEAQPTLEDVYFYLTGDKNGK